MSVAAPIHPETKALEGLEHLVTKKAQRPVRTPTVLQMEALDCGPATLAIVLGHFGRWVSLDELREAAGVSRNGSNASMLLQVARAYGLEVQGLKAEPDALRRLKPPMILHWDFSHFVVFEGFVRQDRARINDPRTGPREISLEELDKSMTGVVLVTRPGPEFEAKGRPPQLFSALRSRLSGSGLALLFLFLTSALLLGPGLALPALTRLFIDKILVGGEQPWVLPIFAGLGLMGLVSGLVTWMQREHLLRLETRMAVVESSRFLWHLLRLPLDFFHQRFTGDISSRVGLNDQIAQLLSRQLATNALGVVVILVFGFFMFRIDPVLTLTSLAVISLNAAVLRWVSRKRSDSNRRLLREQGNLNGIALWGLEMIESLKATGSETDLFSRWAGQQAKVVNLRQTLERVNLPLQTLPAFLTALNTAVILGIGGLRVVDGQLTLGSLIAFQMLTAAFVAPANRLVNLGGRLQLAEGEVALCSDVLQTVPEVDLQPRRSLEDAGEPLAGRLEIQGVTFGYTGEEPVLRDIDFALEPGDWVALVGKTGSGKSTMSKLVAGLYEPWDGEILFDGTARRDLDRSRWTRSVAVVDQDIFVFEGTLRENLTMWDPSVPTERLIQACADAEILDDVMRRPGGLDAEVREGGTNWSGGQLQRIEIARALAGNPSLLLLDEATSALDPETERKIVANLKRRGISCLIVAHRLSTVRDADEILVFEGGRIVERGDHESLVTAGRRYAELVVHE